MQIRTAKIRLLILTSIAIFLSSCSISDWYNGYYAERTANKEIQKKVDDYYNSESPQMQELRKQNQAYCLNLAAKPENRIAKDGYPNGLFNQPMFSRCMIDRGTPTYESYGGVLQRKHDEELRAKGKRVM